VDTDGPGDVKVCRLRESLEIAAQYVTLSHCWGSDPEAIPKTTRQNLPERLRGIPWCSLSKTFQEAVEVTRWPGN
jgi:hypothetical protein